MIVKKSVMILKSLLYQQGIVDPIDYLTKLESCPIRIRRLSSYIVQTRGDSDSYLSNDKTVAISYNFLSAITIPSVQNKTVASTKYSK